MTDQIIDEAIASVSESAQPEAQEAELDNQAPEGTDDQQSGEPQDKAANDSDNQPFPKKAERAIAKRDHQIRKRDAIIHQMRAELSKFQQQNNPSGDLSNKESKAPKEEDFENYGDYLKAATKYEVRQELEQQHAQQQKTAQDAAHKEQFNAWFESESDKLAAYTEDQLSKDPSLKQFVEEYGDVIDQIPQTLEVAFLQFKPEEAIAAARMLAEEGKLEALFSAPYAAAIAEIGRAAVRGAAAQKAKTISKAPAPMNANRGIGSASKSIESMSYDELLKAL